MSDEVTMGQNEVDTDIVLVNPDLAEEMLKIGNGDGSPVFYSPQTGRNQWDDII